MAKDGTEIVKTSSAIVRLMCEYDHLKMVKAKKAENPTATCFSARRNPIVHKDDCNLLFQNEDTLTYYVRFYRASTDFSKHSHTKYEIGGKAYTYEEVCALGIVAPSKLRSSSSGEPIPCFTVALDNVVQIGNLVFED